MLSNILDRIAFWSLATTIILLPVFFLPYFRIPIETAKTLLVVLGLSVAIITWSAARFSDGRITIPKSPIFFGGLFLIIAFLVSSVFSLSRPVSFFGAMFDSGTFWFMLTAVLLAFFSSLIISDNKKSKIVLYGFLVSVFILFIFQTARYFLPQFLSFGILGDKTSNLFGAWSGLGFFAGLSVIAVLFIIDFMRPSRHFKVFLYVLLSLSMLSIMAVNSVIVWELTGIFALFVFIYRIASSDQSEHGRHIFPINSFVVVIIALLFFLSGKFIGEYVPNALGLTNLEVSPSLSATLEVGKNALKQYPVFGVGPNNFSKAWAMWRPDVINNTQFWDTTFNTGSGFLPTSIINLGLFGVLAWIVFLALFLTDGIKMLFETIQRRLDFKATFFFFISLFLLTVTFVYPLGIAGIMLAFAMIGIFISEYSRSRTSGFFEVNFLNDPRASLLSILVLVGFMIVTSGLCFKFIERFASVAHFNKAILATDIKKSREEINKALTLSKNDLYLRTYAQIELARLNEISIKTAPLSDSEKAELQSAYQNAIESANMAIKYDQNNQLNHQILGLVYATVGKFGVDGAHDKAITSYSKATELNPKNPGLRLSIANEYVAMNKNMEAKKEASQALNLAPNYVDALILLSQLEKQSGNLGLAVGYANRALALDPSNKILSDYVKGLTTNNATTPIEENNKKSKK